MPSSLSPDRRMALWQARCRWHRGETHVESDTSRDTAFTRRVKTTFALSNSVEDGPQLDAIAFNELNPGKSPNYMTRQSLTRLVTAGANEKTCALPFEITGAALAPAMLSPASSPA